MALIERRELPHRDVFEVITHFSALSGVTPPVAADDVMMPFIAHKRAWLLGMTIYCDTVSVLAAIMQLEVFLAGVTGESTGGSITASETVDLNALTAGEIITSDMGLANLINDGQSSDFANTTDVLDMSGAASGAAVTVETPIQIEPGGGLVLAFTVASAASFIGTVTVWLTEHPI